MLFAARPLVPRHRPELRTRRRRVHPRLERHRRVPRSRRRPPHLGPDLQGHVREARTRRDRRPGEARRAGAGGPAPASERVVRPPGPARAGRTRRPAASRSTRPEASLRSTLRPGPRPGRASCGRSGRSTSSAGPIEPSSARLLDHEHESVRAWAIRLLTDDLPLDTIFSRRIGPDVELPADLLAKLAAMARDDPSGLVRLVLASTLQRLPVGPARGAGPGPAVARRGRRRPQPAGLDLDGPDPGRRRRSRRRSLALAADCRLPDVVRLIARRLGEDIESRPAPVNALLGGRRRPAGGVPVAGRLGPRRRPGRLAQGEEARGLGRASRPSSTSTADPTLRDRVRELNVLFGDGRALEEVRRLALDEKAEHRDAEGRAADLDREPAARPAVDLRAAGPRPLPERRGRARAGPVRRPGDRQVARRELSGVPPLGAPRGDRHPGLPPGVRPGPARPDRRRARSRAAISPRSTPGRSAAWATRR